MIIKTNTTPKMVECGETINSAGLVTITNNKAYVPFDYGDDYIFSNVSATRATVIDIDTDKALVFYNNNSGGINIRIATITGNVVTYGNAITTVSGQFSYYDSVVKISTNKVMLGYTFMNKPNAMIIQVIDDSIVVGSSYELKNTNSTSYPQLALYFNNRVLAMYRDSNDSNKVYRNLLTVSGDTISVGTATFFSEIGSYRFMLKPIVTNSIDWTSSQYLVVTYNLENDGIYAQKLRIIHISGTNVYVGDEVSVDNLSSSMYLNTLRVISVNNNGFVFVWAYNGHILAKVFYFSDISANNIFSGETTVLSNYESTILDNILISISENNFIYCFNNGTTITLFNVDGFSIKKLKDINGINGTRYWESGSACKLSNGKCLVCYDDDNGSDYGYTKVLTINNYTGISLTPQFSRNNINVIPYISLV